MLLGRCMQFTGPYHRPRLRLLAAVTGAAFLAVSASACSTTERLSTGMKVRSAVIKLGEQPSSTVVASVDATTRQARAFLTRARGKTATHQEAVRLARAEVTLAAGSGDEETPLKDMPASDAADVAAAVNFGGKDVAAVKSVDDELYLRVSLRGLVRQADGSHEARGTASRIVGLADDLPPTLLAAKDALEGEWVRADPDAFDEFAKAAETLTGREKADEGDKDGRDGNGKGKGSKSGMAREDGGESDEARRSREIRDAVTIGSALDGQSQREFVSGVQDLLRQHAEFADKGEHDGADRVQMTLPGRTAAKDLVAALRPLGAEIDPDRVPRHDITADLDIRRGQLTTLTLDVGQFTPGGPRLPLRLDFSGGDAVAVTAPGGTKELQPQDLVAGLMYGALGTDRF